MRNFAPLVAISTGLLIVSMAQAQPAEIPIDESRITIIHAGRTAGYRPRSVDLDVYNVGVPSQTGGGWASSGVNVYDDITFGGRAISGPIRITQVVLGIIEPVTVTPAYHLYARLSFYPNHNNTVPTSTPPYSGAPITGSIDLGTFGNPPPFPGGSSLVPYPVALESSLDETNVFNDGPTDRTTGLKIELFLDPQMTVYADDWAVVRRANLSNASSTQLTLPTGSSDLFAWFSASTGVTHGTIANSQRSGGFPTNNRATYLALYASYTCGTADYNGDGDLGTEADIEDFFACLAGNCCPTCWPGGADFNGDGDSGTDADIEAFFHALAGGSC